MLRTLHHVCVETNCYERSLSFYRDVLGFAVICETGDFGGNRGRRYNTWLKNVDIMIELETPKRGLFRLPFRLPLCRKPSGIDHICFMVDDIEREVSRIRAAGHADFKEKDGSAIYLVSGVPLCKVIAPEGTVIELREQDICF